MRFEIYDIEITPFIEFVDRLKSNGKAFKKKIPKPNFYSSFKIKAKEDLPLASAYVDEFGQIFICDRRENINEVVSYLRPVSVYFSKNTLRLSTILQGLPKQLHTFQIDFIKH